MNDQREEARAGSPAGDQYKAALHSVLHEICGSVAAQLAGWRVSSEMPGPAEQWIFVHNQRSVVRPQGWKLHVSAGVATAEAVLRRALSVLLAEDASFKV